MLQGNSAAGKADNNHQDHDGENDEQELNEEESKYRD
jgi:hypothetical protein